jgi:predicted methyltransferase
MWLANKLNQIKQKYRSMATACLLRTRLAFVGEVQHFYDAAKATIGDVQILNDNPQQQQQYDQSNMSDETTQARSELSELQDEDEE